MKETNSNHEQLTAWSRPPAPNLCRLTSTRKASAGNRYLNGSKKAVPFITILVVMAIWLASPASAVFGLDKTDVDIFAFNTDRTLQGRTDGWEPFPGPGPGYNIVRTFRNSAGQLILLTLNGNTGEYTTFAPTADGYLGSTKAGGGPQKELRCNAAEYVKLGNEFKLVTQDSFTGMIRIFPVNDNGAPNLNAITKSLVLDMRDKNLFSAYESQISLYETSLLMTGVNTWTGEMATYSLNTMQKVITQTWSRGWTSTDYLKIGSVTYRLLYKASGDPYKSPAESGDQARRFVIETATADGSSWDIQDNYLAADMGDLSSIRFVQFPAVRSGYNYGIFFYRRTTGDYSIYGFDPQIGLGAKLDSGSLKGGAFAGAPPAPPYLDVAPYLVSNKTFLACVSPDKATPLGYEQAEKMGQVMHDSLKNNTVGYQFVLAQSGRIFFSRGYGKNRLEHDSSADTAMTTRSHLNIGSVSKVITTLTVLKLAQQNKIDLKADISNYLDAGQVEPYKWPTITPVVNLLTHTSGVSGDKCTANTGNLTVDCKDFFNAQTDSVPACGFVGGKYNCNYSYNNSNFVAARKVIENVTGAQDSKDIDDQTHKLWADSVDLDAITCKVSPSAFYYGPCNGAADCFDYAGKSWRRYWPAGDYSWSEYCSSGGWNASSQELIHFLGAIRYRNALDKEFTNTLLSTDLVDVDNDGTAIGWDPPWSAGGETILGKGGFLPSHGTAARAYITRLPNNCDAVVQLNSNSDVKVTPLLQDSFNNAVLGKTLVKTNGDYSTQLGDDTTATAINTTRTTQTESEHVVVSRTSDGNLKLRAFQASRLIDAPQLDLIAEKTINFPAPGLSTDNVAITDGSDFATASLAKLPPGNLLNLTTWNFNGALLTKQASAFGPITSGNDVAVVKIASKVAGVGTLTRVVTAVKNTDGVMQLDVWDCFNAPLSPQLSTITHVGKIVDTEWSESLDIKNLGAVGDFTKAARLVTAYRASSGFLTVKAWQVDVNGSPQFKSSEIFTSYYGTDLVASTALKHRVAIDTAGDGVSGFFDGHGFMTTFIAQDTAILNVVTWYADDAGLITFKSSKKTGVAVLGQGLTSTTTIVMLANDPNTSANEKGMEQVIKWAVANDGTITSPWNKKPGFRVTDVAATGNLVGSFVQFAPAFTLRVVNWAVLDSP